MHTNLDYIRCVLDLPALDDFVVDQSLHILLADPGCSEVPNQRDPSMEATKTMLLLATETTVPAQLTWGNVTLYLRTPSASYTAKYVYVDICTSS